MYLLNIVNSAASNQQHLASNQQHLAKHACAIVLAICAGVLTWRPLGPTTLGPAGPRFRCEKPACVRATHSGGGAMEGPGSEGRCPSIVVVRNHLHLAGMEQTQV